MRFIGLVGPKRAGKDTVGDMICKIDPSFRKVAFADVLKATALGADPYVDCNHADPNLWAGDFPPFSEFKRLTEVVQRLGWEKAKELPDVRRFLQRLGTEGGRQCIDDNVWVRATWDQYVYPHVQAFDQEVVWEAPSFVFTDVRFPNEIGAIRGVGGEIWRIERESAEDGDPHPSERAWREETPDLVIANHDGTLEELRNRVECALFTGLAEDPN